MLRGHVWESPAFPKAVQETALREAGVTDRAIYRNNFDAVLTSLRAGDRLVVAGFRGLGRSREVIVSNVKRVHAKKCAVMDAETGRLSTKKSAYAALVDEAVRAIANERRGPRKNRHKGRRPWDQIVPIWRDTTLKTKDAMAMINHGFKEISHTTVFRKLGKRGALPGRPSKKRI